VKNFSFGWGHGRGKEKVAKSKEQQPLNEGVLTVYQEDIASGKGVGTLHEPKKTWKKKGRNEVIQKQSLVAKGKAYDAFVS